MGWKSLCGGTFQYIIIYVPDMVSMLSRLERYLMAQWLRRAFQGHAKCTVHDLKVMGSNPSQVELGMHITSV